MSEVDNENKKVEVKVTKNRRSIRKKGSESYQFDENGTGLLKTMEAHSIVSKNITNNHVSYLVKMKKHRMLKSFTLREMKEFFPNLHMDFENSLTNETQEFIVDGKLKRLEVESIERIIKSVNVQYFVKMKGYDQITPFTQSKMKELFPFHLKAYETFQPR